MEAGGHSGTHGAPRRTNAAIERRRRLLHRGLPAAAVVTLAIVLLVAFAGGGPGRDERRTARAFAEEWARGDYARMYSMLDGEARDRVTADQFADAYRTAALTATVRTVDVGEVGDRQGDAIPVALTIRTRAFGTVRGVLELPVSGSGDAMRIAWRAHAVFPGLRAGEQLSRTTSLPPRAALLARDGTVLAQGAARTSADPGVAGHVVGHLEPLASPTPASLRAQGYPDGALAGASGLERVFESALAGRPGGTLYAGTRVLARTTPSPAAAVRTTIDPDVQRAAVTALAGRYGGIVAIVPSTGEILALAGLAYSAAQPPGSTFKIVTLTGVLEHRLAKAGTAFPVLSETQIEGVTLENANGEYCGGTLVQSFAHSCNTVFAPLGAQLGARRLVDVAERFGFNEPPPIPGAIASTIPTATAIGDPLAVGSSAIGQGLVQATALQMTSVAATIATRGRRPVPTLRLGETPRLVRVTRPGVAREVARMMRAAVDDGTGFAAAISGVAVAGKTGTAELASTVVPDEETVAEGETGVEAEAIPPVRETDAWFVGYGPAQRPRIAVGALFVEAGTGGDVAAPAVRQVLIAALQRKRR